MTGKLKALLIETYETNAKIQPKEIVCISDSIQDMEMLQKGTKSITVNPNKKLQQIAKANNWSILVT